MSDPDRDSLFTQLGKGLLPDEESRDRFEEVMDQMTDADGAQIDLAALSGLVTGAERTNLIESFSQANRRQPEPAVEKRPITDDDDQVVGFHCFVSEPPETVQVWRGSESLLVSSSMIEQRVGLPFQPGSVEWVEETDTISEFVVWQQEPVAGALPPGDETDGENDA